MPEAVREPTTALPFQRRKDSVQPTELLHRRIVPPPRDHYVRRNSVDLVRAVRAIANAIRHIEPQLAILEQGRDRSVRIAASGHERGRTDHSRGTVVAKQSRKSL